MLPEQWRLDMQTDHGGCVKSPTLHFDLEIELVVLQV